MARSDQRSCAIGSSSAGRLRSSDEVGGGQASAVLAAIMGALSRASMDTSVGPGAAARTSSASATG